MTAEDNHPEEIPLVAKSRFSELDELQKEIALRIKDNQRFLAGFLSEDYADDDEDKEDDLSDYEEL